MKKWNELQLKYKVAAGGLIVAILGFAAWQYQSGTKVSYYEVGTQSVEQLINVKAQAVPKVSSWYKSQTGGVITELLAEKDMAVEQEALLLSIQPFDVAMKQAEISAYIDTLSTLQGVALSEAEQVSYPKALKAFQEQDQALRQAWLAHEGALELFGTQMISSDAYRESLVQINTQLVTYIEKTEAFAAYLGALNAKDERFNDLKGKILSAFEPVKALKPLLLPEPDNGKAAVEPSAQLQAYKSGSAGVVSRVTAAAGMYVPAGTPLIEVADPAYTSLIMEVPVAQLEDIKAGSALRLNAPGTASPVPGAVTTVGNTITDQMQPDGSIQKWVQAGGELEKDAKVKWFENYSVSLVAASVKDAVVIPKDLVIEKAGEHTVWINEAGVLTEKAIEIDFEVNDLYVVKKGVNKGDKLVQDTRLRLGQKIKF